MADITLKLIWYRLGETYTNCADRYEKFLDWYQDFSWSRVDFLDMLFLGWLLAAFIVVGLINIYLRFFGRLKPAGSGVGGTGWGSAGVGLSAGGAPGVGESCQWVNSLLSWLYLHYEHTPEFVDCWLKALNEQARKQTGDVQIKFDRIQAGSLPPKFTQVSSEAGPRDNMTVTAQVESADLVFLVSLLQQTGANIKIHNCDVTVSKLRGQLKAQLKALSHYTNEQIEVAVSFASKPEIVTNIRQRNIENVDYRQLEVMIHEAITGAIATFSLPSKGGYPDFSAQLRPEHILAQSTPYRPQPMRSPTFPVSNGNLDAKHSHNALQKGSCIKPMEATKSSQPIKSRPDLPFQPIKKQEKATYEAVIEPQVVNSIQFQNASAKPSSMRNQRLLVKVIKANSLGDKDFGCSDPYCIVQMDQPQQKHTTSVVKNTVNPFWDEHFLFDLDDMSREVKFEVFDREKPPGDDFLGRAVLPVSELRRMPSSRQIIPLTGRPRAQGTQSGSLTVEFLFMEPADAQRIYSSGGVEDSINPRRSISTHRQTTPGGVNVTTTTMTTERLKDMRLDASFNESPARIQKSDTLQAPSDYSPYSSRSSGYGGEARENLSGSQARKGSKGFFGRMQNQKQTKDTAANRPLGSPQVMVTQPTGPYDTYDMHAKNEEPINVPIIQMMDGSPTDERASSTMSQASTPVDNREGKKKGGFANTLRRRFGKNKNKQRSQSADRAGALGRGEVILNVPGEPPYTTKSTDPDTRSIKSTKSTKSLNLFSWRSKSRERDQDPDTKSIKSTKSLKFFPLRSRSKSRDLHLPSPHTDDLDGVDIPQDGIRKSRSHSFSSSLKNLFKKKKKNKGQNQGLGPGGEPYPPSSRESSVSRGGGGLGPYDHPAYAQASPDISSRDASAKHSPDINRDYPHYSSSVPAHAPIYDR